MLPLSRRALGPRFFDSRAQLGLWFWEVSDFPERWLPSFDHVDEVWVASEHVADALATALPDDGADDPVPVCRRRRPS